MSPTTYVQVILDWSRMSPLLSHHTQVMPCTLLASSCLIYILLLMSAAVHGRLVNVTIDDQSPSLFYSNLWGDGGSCLSCLAAPNASQAIHKTWHDSTVSSLSIGSGYHSFISISSIMQTAKLILIQRPTYLHHSTVSITLS